MSKSAGTKVVANMWFVAKNKCLSKIATMAMDKYITLVWKWEFVMSGEI